MISGVPDKQFKDRLTGSELVTVVVLYQIPDHLDFLQVFIWQEIDFAPHFPKLMKFLDFWDRKLDGPIYEARRMNDNKVITPAEIRAYKPPKFYLN